jgi:hypothetical protein
MDENSWASAILGKPSCAVEDNKLLYAQACEILRVMRDSSSERYCLMFAKKLKIRGFEISTSLIVPIV